MSQFSSSKSENHQPDPQLTPSHRGLITLVQSKGELTYPASRIKGAGITLWFSPDEVELVNRHIALHGAEGARERWELTRKYSCVSNDLEGVDGRVSVPRLESAIPVRLLRIDTFVPNLNLNSKEGHYHRRGRFVLSETAETEVTQIFERVGMLDLFKIEFDSAANLKIENPRFLGVHFSLEWFGSQNPFGDGVDLRVHTSWQAPSVSREDYSFNRCLTVDKKGSLVLTSFSSEFAESGYEGHDFLSGSNLGVAEFETLHDVVRRHVVAENLVKPKTMCFAYWFGNSFID